MPALIVIVLIIVVTVAVIPLVHAVVAVIAAHMALIGLVLAAGVPVTIVVLVALMKGASKHTVVAWHEPRALPAPEPRHELPAPARPAPRLAAGTLGGYWPEEDEEPDASVPEPVLVAEDCDGPRCAAPCGPSPWTVEVEVDRTGKGPVTETRRFCSARCAEEYTWTAPEAGVIPS